MTALGIDFGTKRIGIAISDEERIIAAPLETYQRRGLKADLAYISELAARNEVTTLVVGLPLNMDGSEGGSAAKARAFAEKLEAVAGVPMEMFDERLSSVSADDAMIQAGLSREQRSKRIDKVAAQMILQTYLDAGKSRNPPI